MKTILATAAVLIGAVGASAQASDVEVRFDRDLLESAKGQHKVYDMFETKARRSCLSKAPVTPRTMTVSRCQQELVASLVTNLGHEQVTRIHQLNTGYRLTRR